ncbi:Stk1 family PASTA domain-containing Ser/Thr kinase [Agromyces atrinae]|uniref:Stk1 family PASTA domain-containing Ser/Thr kinase n=1 Tax=Agromyces atrinae TaxID=592376 RepID=UPI001F5A53DD|nr:Stk1 family PASTA domain-containing Ser/Thr kinase [Agromyces atrinae]MCI2958839.1 Stk1 family PASTA domain-containing Ser/Thr kinase [Agromyces atrinae]
MTTPPADPLIGRLIDGRYQVRSRIARGGMATVYLATDLRLERRVAIKIMHGHLADDATFKDRFVQEARSAARLAHPNVVNVFDQGQDADSAYLVMEYLPGITLRDLLKDYTSLTPEQTVDIMDAVLSGLAAAHKAGIVHRDLKPENVLLADDGRIKLGDFGLARAASANTATGQALLGTIAYLSPELVTRGVADARSDIYAVGIMMYEMLTGEQPYVGEAPMQIAYQHANDQVPAPSSKNPAIPAAFDELVRWSTERDPEQRPRDARELLDRLRSIESSVRRPDPIPTGATLVLGERGSTGETQFLGTTLLGPEPETPEPDDASALLVRRSERRKRKGYWLFALVILLTALAGGTGWYFGSGPGSQVVIPDVRGAEMDAAEQTLLDSGFQVTRDSRYDWEIAVGLASATAPDGAAPRGSTITLYSSLGPRSLPVPDVVGTPEADARSALSEFAVAADAITQFDDEIPAGSVIAALDSEGNGLGDSYFERAPITLVVSLGSLPDLVGDSVEDAFAALTELGLTPVEGERQFVNDGSIPADHVISISPEAEGPVRPGATIIVTVSQGQDLVEIPATAGTPMAEALDALRAAGFEVTYNLPDAFLPFATVTSTNPEGGGQAVRGSTIAVVGTITL